MTKAKALLITDRIPIDSSMHGSPRTFELCNALSDEFEFGLFYISTNNLPLTESSESLFSPIRIHQFDPVLKNSYQRLFRRFSPTASFDYRTTHHSEVKFIKNNINKFFIENNFGLILVDGLSSSQYVPDNLLDKSALDLCDCLSKLQLRALKRTSTIRELVSSIMSLIGIWHWERRTLKQFRRTLIISEDDTWPLKFLNFRYKAPALVPLGVNLEYFKSTKELPINKTVLFFGALSYQPNLDASLWILEDIFPLLLKTNPDSKLVIAGSLPPKEISDLAKRTPNVEIISNPIDIRPYIDDSSIILTPMRLGAGVKNKLLVAISMKRPVISTQIGLEGVVNSISKQIYTANNPREFCDRISNIFSLIENQDKCKKMENDLSSLREILSEYYSWKSAALPLKEVFNEIIKQ
ncbi:MAG TPA: glycosyltransferase [Oligoflexia bacterium]|nr:glycosyltransferase [Oligoflexia bacterium]HMP47041.1 glycosyltransferase [Oligoflexia bacterium]